MKHYYSLGGIDNHGSTITFTTHLTENYHQIIYEYDHSSKLSGHLYPPNYELSVATPHVCGIRMFQSVPNTGLGPEDRDGLNVSDQN